MRNLEQDCVVGDCLRSEGETVISFGLIFVVPSEGCLIGSFRVVGFM